MGTKPELLIRLKFDNRFRDRDGGDEDDTLKSDDPGHDDLRDPIRDDDVVVDDDDDDEVVLVTIG